MLALSAFPFISSLPIGGLNGASSWITHLTILDGGCSFMVSSAFLCLAKITCVPCHCRFFKSLFHRRDVLFGWLFLALNPLRGSRWRLRCWEVIFLAMLKSKCRMKKIYEDNKQTILVVNEVAKKCMNYVS